MSAAELVTADSCRETEEQLAKLRTTPGGERLRPTVSAVIFSLSTKQILLCASAAQVNPSEDELKFPQGGIEPYETAAAALVREVGEETGIDPDAFICIHGLAGPELVSSRRRDGRQKVLLPMAGIVEGAPEVRPNEELSLVGWYGLEYAQKIIGGRPPTNSSHNTQEILARFISLAEASLAPALA